MRVKHVRSGAVAEVSDAYGEALIAQPSNEWSEYKPEPVRKPRAPRAPKPAPSEEPSTEE